MPTLKNPRAQSIKVSAGVDITIRGGESKEVAVVPPHARELARIGKLVIIENTPPAPATPTPSAPITPDASPDDVAPVASRAGKVSNKQN